MATEVQLTYSDTAGVAYPGMLGDAGRSYKKSFQNSDAAVLPAGIFVAKDSASPELKAKKLAAVTDKIAGVIIHSHARNSIAGQGYENGAQMGVLREGSIYVQAEQTMAVGDDVYVRVAAGAGTVLGAIRKDNDAGTCLLLKGAHVIAGGGTANPPQIYFSAALQEAAGDMVEILFDHAQAAADRTDKIWKNRTERHFLIEQVVYDNVTGLAQDASNVFNIKLQQGAGPTIAANWDTTTGQQGTIAADTWVTLVNAALANRVVPPAAELSLFLDMSGSQTLPAGRIRVHGRYL